MAADENERTYGTSTAKMTTNTMQLLQIDSQNSRKRSFRFKELSWVGSIFDANEAAEKSELVPVLAKVNF